MNEPGDALRAGPHVARLTPSTRAHSMVRALKRPPRHGLSIGLADILQSRAILLLVSGRQKIAPLRRMMNGRVTTRCPASLLWLHADVTVHCDRESSPALGRVAR
jgi:galactosamine-6-phosphate isomerase